MKIPRFILDISERLEKWAAEMLPAAAPGSARDSIHRHLLAGALIVLLLWIFYSAQIFLLGAEFTRAWACVFGSRCDGR